MDSSLILNQLSTMGFSLEEVPNLGDIFTFEGMNFLYMPEEGDDEFFRIAMPNIFDVTADNKTFLLDIVNNLNVRMKYSKSVITGDGVWLFYEHRMDEDENLEELIEHAVFLLRATAYTFHRMVNGENLSSDRDEDEFSGGEVSSDSGSGTRQPWEE